jgi:hypothetical protein
MDALHRSTREDFRSTWFSNLRFFCDLLCNFKVSANFFKKKRYNERWTACWFEIDLRRFSQKILRGSLERGLIFDKEVLFAKKPGAHPIWTTSWFRNNLRLFSQNILRGLWSASWFLKNKKGFFCKMTMARQIWAVRVPNQTRSNGRESGRRGHAGRWAFGGRIHMEKAITIPYHYIKL